MINTVRPYRFFQCLGSNNQARLTIPNEPGTESLTIFSVETLLLIAVARIIAAHSILELGTGLGYTALHLAQNTEAHIFTIDNEKKPAVFDGTEWAGNITGLTADVSQLEPSPADMVFCDINPTLELCRLCTAIAFGCNPKVIAWHDYHNPDYPAQTENLDELAKTHDIYHVEDTRLCLWFAGGLA